MLKLIRAIILNFQNKELFLLFKIDLNHKSAVWLKLFDGQWINWSHELGIDVFAMQLWELRLLVLGLLIKLENWKNILLALMLVNSKHKCVLNGQELQLLYPVPAFTRFKNFILRRNADSVIDLGPDCSSQVFFLVSISHSNRRDKFGI